MFFFQIRKLSNKELNSFAPNTAMVTLGAGLKSSSNAHAYTPSHHAAILSPHLRVMALNPWVTKVPLHQKRDSCIDLLHGMSSRLK